jgi:hypothetical protein
MQYIEGREVRIVRGFPVVFLSGDSMPSDTVVCPRCRGRGSHINPAIDGDGFTGEEWAMMDEDFKESYWNGNFDVICSVCNGLRVTAKIATDQLNAEQWELLYEQERNEADMADMIAAQKAEMAMGA